jgi:TetR/AcrR family transcriptional regulator, regulator of mycofactocin system
MSGGAEVAGPAPRVGRRRSTTGGQITEIALDLFATYGFSEISVDDIALASGIARRTLFRYYPSKNAIPWGDFDSYLQRLAALLDDAGPGQPMREALRTALLDFNTFDDSETAQHRLRMKVILESPELQAYSMTMYAGWRAVVAGFVARRSGADPEDLMPQTVAWLMLGVALSAYRHWLAHPDPGSAALRRALGEAFDAVAGGLP